MTINQIYCYIAIFTILTMQIDKLVGQCKCDTLADNIFVATEIPPKMDKSIDELEVIVNKEIDLNKYDLKVKEIYVSFIINCKGEDINYKVLKCDNRDFNKILTDCLMNNLNWIPAEQNSKKVDFSYVFGLRIENGRINILDDSEKKKLKRKK